MSFLDWFKKYELPQGRKFGWKRDLPDFRDRICSVSQTVVPPKVDLRPKCPPVYDQGQLGSCTAQAIAGLIQYDKIALQRPSAVIPSRLFIYYNERVMEGTIGIDAGASIRDGIKSLNTYGFCHEGFWPYLEQRFSKRPSDACYKEARTNIVQTYERVGQSQKGIKAVLADGFPVVFGSTVFDSFMSNDVAKTGVVTYPKTTESAVGGHAMLIVGYDDSKRVFIVRNSWGEGWGDKGYCYFPYEYITDMKLSADFWTVRFVN